MNPADSLERFRDFLDRPESEQDPASGALLYALNEYPGLDVELYLGRLDALGRAAAQRIRGRRDPYQIIGALNRLLFEEERFAGNERKYYDPRNSFLNQVLDRRLGIPISLSVLYAHVAARSRLPVSGIAFPGHFIVRFERPAEPIFLDPFRAGRILTRDDLLALLARHSGGPESEIDPALLEPATTRDVLARMLRNLKSIYQRTQDARRRLWVTEALLMVDPESGADLRDRGLARMELGRYPEALRDLLAYSARNPYAEDVARVDALVQDLRRLTALMN